MIALEISRVTVLAHAQKLQWLLEECRASGGDKESLGRIERMICEAQRLAAGGRALRVPCSCQQDQTPTSSLALERLRPLVTEMTSPTATDRRCLATASPADKSLLDMAPQTMIRARAKELSNQRWGRWHDDFTARGGNR